MNNEQFAKVIVESVSEFGIVDLVISATGLTVLAVWLVKTTFGARFAATMFRFIWRRYLFFCGF
jgi:hypothetical protein